MYPWVVPEPWRITLAHGGAIPRSCLGNRLGVRLQGATLGVEPLNPCPKGPSAHVAGL